MRKINLEELINLIMDNDKFIITTHINPDGDAIGSALALTHYLRNIGKGAICLIDDDIPNNFNFLLESTLIEKPGPNKLDVDLMIVLDSSDLERIGKVANVSDASILNIDHHISNNEFADYLYLDTIAAATGEILFKLLKYANADFNEIIAYSLYTAIATDCGFFKYSNTSADTMKYAASLIELGVKPNIVSEAMEKKSLNSIKSLSSVLNTLELFSDNKIAILSITKEITETCESTEGFIDFPRTIEGVELAILIKYINDNCCRISMRSTQVDVSIIAKKFGGGGHKKAAGCTVYNSLLESKKLIINMAIKVMGGEHV